jgi:hypothetical protein
MVRRMVPPIYQGRASDVTFGEHLAIVEARCSHARQATPWSRTDVIDQADWAGPRDKAGHDEMCRIAPRTPAADFEPRWQEILGRVGGGWLNIVPACVIDEALIVVVEYRPVEPGQTPTPPERIHIPGHSLTVADA